MTAQRDPNAEGPSDPGGDDPGAGAADKQRNSAEFTRRAAEARGAASQPRQSTPFHERATTPDPGAIDSDLARPSIQLKRSTLVSLSEKATLANGADFEIPEEASRESERDRYLGCVIDDRYLIRRTIARGGMGVVYEGRHQVIDKRVAIKVLRPDFADDPDVTARFLTEAKAASQIGNIRIIDVTDFGQLPDGATYLVMEFLDGQSLGKLIRSRELARPGLDPAARLTRLVHIGRQIADGLSAAHDADIVHRDLKPDNLFLIEHGGDPDFVKILDFGIAKVASGQNRQTRAGRIFGTPHYMAPEQAEGNAIDQRTDIYALGVILYEMASGRTPFDAENPLGILTQHLYVKAPALSTLEPNPDVSPGLEAIIMKCLSKAPAQRYQTMRELDADLARIERNEVPMAVLDLTERHDSVMPARSLKAARKGSKSAVLPWALILLTIGGAVLAAGAFFNRVWKARELARMAPTASASASASAAPPVSTAKDLVSVALVISPIDAHVFSGNKDLGTMPINIKVPKNRTAVVEVRREGYRSRRVAVDGTQAKLIIVLEPLPGTRAEDIAAASPGPAEAKTYLLRPVDEDADNLESVPLSSAVLEPAGRAGASGAPSQRFNDLDDLDELDEPLPEPAEKGHPPSEGSGAAGAPPELDDLPPLDLDDLPPLPGEPPPKPKQEKDRADENPSPTPPSVDEAPPREPDAPPDDPESAPDP